MPKDIDPPQIRSRDSPRKIITADFRSIDELPILGGWGYTQENAVIINRNDPVVSEEVPFDGVGLEYIFVEKRIYEELIIFRPKGRKFSGIKWNLLEQNLLNKNGRTFDHLKFEVTALPDRDWEELKSEWDGPNGYVSLDFDKDTHNRERDAKTVRYITEYWFDITSFYVK